MADSTSTSFGSSSGTSSASSSGGQSFSPDALARINDLYPQIRQQIAAPNLGQIGQSIRGGYRWPTINQNPIYNPQQIQQQVNAMRSQNDAAAGGQVHNMGQYLAGRGYGGTSPLSMQLSQNILAQNRAGNAAAEQQLRFQAAAANAQQVLNAQQAASQQAAAQAGLANQGYATVAQYQNALLQALYQYNQPLYRTQSQSQSKQSAVNNSRSSSGGSSGGGGGYANQPAGGTLGDLLMQGNGGYYNDGGVTVLPPIPGLYS